MLLDRGEDALERVARHVLSGGVAEADAAIGERGGDAAREIGARLRAQHQEPRHFVMIGFGGERTDRAGAEHDAHRIGMVSECIGHKFSIRHCEERSDEAIQRFIAALDCFASLAMTKPLFLLTSLLS